MQTLVSVYDMPSDVATVVRKLKARGFDDLTTYSPAPFAEIEEAEDPAPSGVRAFTLIGGLIGVVTGFAWGIGHGLSPWTGHSLFLLGAWAIYLGPVSLRLVRQQHGTLPARGVVVGFASSATAG